LKKPATAGNEPAGFAGAFSGNGRQLVCRGKRRRARRAVTDASPRRVRLSPATATMPGPAASPPVRSPLADEPETPRA
jgi:hypothetical protein